MANPNPPSVTSVASVRCFPHRLFLTRKLERVQNHPYADTPIRLLIPLCDAFSYAPSSHQSRGVA